MLCTLGVALGTSFMGVSALLDGVQRPSQEAAPEAMTLTTFLGGALLQVAVGGLSGAVSAPAYSELGGTSMQGRLMGLQSVAEQVGRVISPVVLSVAYERIGPTAPFAIGSGALCLATGALCLVYVLQRSEARASSRAMQ